MDVFVTGGTGTIGAAVVHRLKSAGLNVIALARSEKAVEALRLAGANAYPGDLKDPDSWLSRANACDVVIHTGATFDDDMGRVDRQAMLALKAAAKHRRHPLTVIYTGGVWLFPPNPDGPLISEKTAFSALPAFRFMTETIRTLSNGTDLNLTVIHPGLVCTRSKGPIAEMTKALKNGQPFETRAPPATVWPLVEAADLADLYLRALNLARFRATLIASGIEGISAGHLASHISARHGLPLELQTIEAPTGQTQGKDWSAGYARSQMVDTSHARRLTGWQPEHATVEDLVLALSR
ncbi:NAD-dependent epimerase/dehydratase family protein [Roseibium denhamense]|uniref:Nucleoside-diphosphate-sugar epimerase n=1 Tax=Roseibium denhamense TaxID=76305 RepID=A0ABY1PH86_9HYPH|nr:NAD(P)H-binding protein [Roseibium denhamense]MTI04090.1 NAD-dependent epimerase/dehydratase family protein [Roseibium denhamense]SMP33609.1 Nucleoside-diphosphate-sugar epimerase [Roseibium denhamense]